MAVPIIIVSHPNSGSDVLRGCFSMTSHILDFGTSKELGADIAKIGERLTEEDNELLEFVVIDADYEWFGNEAIVSWALEGQFPVIHLVRENVLDCLLSNVIENQSPELANAYEIVERVQRMRQLTHDLRTKISKVNSLEIQFEKLKTATGGVAPAVVRQLSGWLGIEISGTPAQNSSVPLREPNRQSIDQLKQRFRPELIRSGLEQFVEMPRAA